MRRFWMLSVAWGLLGLACWTRLVHAAEVEGIAVPHTQTVEGQQLVLNGAGFRKIAYFKTDVRALYLPRRASSLEEIAKMPGPKRIWARVLRSAPGDAASRTFMNDFKKVTTDAEFKQLITELGAIGGVYGGYHQMKAGDEVTIDWIPGKGITTVYNGVRVEDQNHQAYMNSELMFQIIMRMNAGGAVNRELQENMLGLSRSMWSGGAAQP